MRRRIVRADSEPGCDAGPERLEHDVGASEKRLREVRLRREVADDRFLAGVQPVVPLAGGLPHRIAARLLDADDARSETQQLTRGERPG